MKKSVAFILSVMLCASCFCGSYAKAAPNNSSNVTLASCINLYKSANYVQAYKSLTELVQKDPSNPAAYYYLAMTSVHMGKKEEAIENYDKAMTLAPNSKLGDYAEKGKRCIETPEKCNAPATKAQTLDRFIRGPFGSGFTHDARGEYEKNKIENLMREMNRSDEIPAERFKEYKDYSSQAPTNDEIVAALRVLQRAGLSNVIGTNGMNTDVSLLNDNRYENGNAYEMLNMLLGNKNSASTLSPQVIQSLLTTQMSSGF